MKQMMISYLAALVLWVPCAAAAEVNRSWETMSAKVVVGKKVVVTRMNLARVEGKLLEVGGDSITVKYKGKPEVVRKEDVFRVRYADIRMKHTLWGLVIGAGAGAAIVGGAEGDWAALIGAAMGSGVGSAAGAALPIGKPLYEVEKPKKEKP